MSFGSWLNNNFAYIFATVILVYTIASNRSMFKDVRKKLYFLMILALTEAVLSQVEEYFATFTVRSVARYVLSLLCYAIRPYILYVILLIVNRKDSLKMQLLYGIPAFFLSVALLIDIPFKNILNFSEANGFVPGPLHPITYIILIIYLAAIPVFSVIKGRKTVHAGEIITVLIAIGFIILNIIGERVIHDFGGQSQMTTILAIMIYAVYFKAVTDREEKQKLETREIKTGLLNEHACVEKLNSMNGDEKIKDYAAIYFDLQRFGFINDQYGMEIGNRVLLEYSKQVETMLHGEEVLARQGSDRFIAIVLKKNLDLFINILEDTRVSFTEKGENYDISISAHVGIFLINETDMQGEEIISNAYAALNYGKSTGTQICYLTDELKQSLRDQKQFIMDIPIAMANEEFVAFYQPKVNSRTGLLCGAEALVRWIHDGNLIPPGKFIPVMETKDLMCDMDFYMLRHVCADLAGWIAHGLVPPTISVNFSRRNLSNPNLAADIDEIVSEYHVPKKLIEIEITETIDEFPISVLNSFVIELHRLGFKVAVDDFGSGSSSLSLLREVSFDTLKIDKGFVDRAYAKDLTILSYMIKLSRAIGVDVLAEGVEQKEQVETLRTLGCEIIQGYFYDKPLPKEVFEERIITRRYNNGEN